jgi:hypothetical protein
VTRRATLAAGRPAPRAIPFGSVSTSRRSARRSRARQIPDPGGSGAPAVGAIAGLVLAVAVFLPWYATNLGPPFSATSASGWDSTNLARVAMVMGVVLFAAAAANLLDERGIIVLDPLSSDALAWVVVGAATIALAAVGFRLLVLPDPAEFLSRQIGLYLAAAAAIAGILSGLGQVAARD